MTQLLISLHQPLAEGRLAAGAVASVRRLADVDGRIVKNWWSKEEPVAIIGGDGSGGSPTVFELPGGGIYSVDITRPRGPDISREIRVAEGEDRAETITLEVSPHEYLGWHQYAGIVRSDPYKRESVRGGTVPRGTGSERLEKLMVKGQEQIDSLYSQVKTVPVAFAADVPAALQAWERVTDSTRGGDRGWATETPLPDRMPTWDDEYATWFLGSPEPQEGIDLIAKLKESDPPADALSAKYPRWIAFDTGGQIDLASVPWPWWGARNEGGEQIRVVYDRVRPSAVDRDVPGRLTVSVLDSRWFGLLEFLASGRLSRAGAMFEQIIEGEEPDALFDPHIALYGKVKGPLVAAAGAIVLIAGADSTEEQRWDPWVKNLSRWFPGIPDGPILLGCRGVTQAQSLGDLNQAFALLREGVERGIPFFSATIRMLSVALSQIGGDVPEADDVRRFVAPVSTRVDPDQTFTVVRL